ncbi:hypothetical protein [Neobacillus soli]|nr:hypothetical protein [Neobacillus soli]
MRSIGSTPITGIMTLLANAVKSTFLTLRKKRFLFISNTILTKISCT